MTGTAEEARKSIHIAMGGFALLLPWLPWWGAAALAVFALIFNLFVLPRVGGVHLYRASDRARGYPTGIILYPAAVLGLILLFPARPDIVAAAWGILAFGDGMATIAGRRAGGPRLPWNREKTIAGSAAFLAFGAGAGVLLALWCRPAVDPVPPLWFALLAPVAAAAAAAFAESVPIRLDDNITVPAIAAAVLWSGSLTSAEAVREALPGLLRALPLALAVNAAVAWAGYRAATVTRPGMVAGGLIGTVIVVTAGWAGWVLLLATFLSAALTSRLGLRRKTLLGIAEERGGRRGAGNAIANTGVAAAAAVLAILTGAREPALVAFAAALTAGGSDTVASEIGKAWGRHPCLVTTLRTVPPGTPGAVSMEGTAAGFVAALALAVLAAALDVVPAGALLPIVAGATIGSLAESLLGASLEAPGILNNDVLNFLNSATAAAAAIVLFGSGG